MKLTIGNYTIRAKFIGLKEVDWDDFDFHLTPVMTYTKVNYKCLTNRSLSLEWGHWALILMAYKMPVANINTVKEVEG